MATEGTTQANKPLATANDAPVAVTKDDEADQGDDGEDDEDEVLETKGRWQKIAEQVSQRDVPGIDAAYLAVDIEEGTEVVWNEVSFSKSKAKRDKDKVIKTLEQLTRLKHPNIVKFYESWCDSESASTTHERLVFITEYMTSGTLLQFLKKSKKNFKPVSEKTWKRWCQQILSALCYLHQLGIIHGNLTLDTIFIQHNGLVKIGSISPEDINKHVKTSVNNLSGAVHYMAPESGEEKLSQATDVYAFGICALEMLALELLGNGENRPKVHADEIKKAIDSLQNESHKKFISDCLTSEATNRPTAKQLLLSPILQEVYTLLLYAAAQVWMHHTNKTLESLPGSSDDTVSHRNYPSFNESDPDKIVADAFNEKVIVRACEIRQLDLEKYFEEHLVDILYQEAISGRQQDGHHLDQQPVQQCDETERKSFDPEMRRVKDGSCEVKVESNKTQIMIKLLFDDRLQRNVTSDLNPDDTPTGLTESLVNCGLINKADQHIVEGWLQDNRNLSMAANVS